MTKLVLVNAIHFKANWELQFDEKNTKEEPFHVSKTETKMVQMMHLKQKFAFSTSSALKSKILELGYMVSVVDLYRMTFLSVPPLVPR